jgi:cysteine desulfuration protein SufE
MLGSRQQCLSPFSVVIGWIADDLVALLNPERMSLLAAALDAIIAELSDADRQERIELLIDFAKSLPSLPERLERLKDAEHRVEECQSPVFLFIELDGDQVSIYADVPIEAPTVRGFVAILVEGLSGATIEEILAVKADLIDRIGLAEILGMQRVRGLGGVLSRLKKEVTKASIREIDKRNES